MNKYKFVKGAGIGGVEMLESAQWGRQLWVIVQVRKKHKCVITALVITSGSWVYRPLTYKGNKHERITREGMGMLRNISVEE